MKKLFSYESKSNFKHLKNMILAEILLVAYLNLTFLYSALKFRDSKIVIIQELYFIFGIFALLSVIALVGILIFTFFTLTNKFKSDLSIEKGYFTLALPYKKSQIFFAKLFSSFFYYLFLGALILLESILIQSIAVLIVGNFWQQFLNINQFLDIFNYYAENLILLIIDSVILIYYIISLSFLSVLIDKLIFKSSKKSNRWILIFFIISLFLSFLNFLFGIDDFNIYKENFISVSYKSIKTISISINILISILINYLSVNLMKKFELY